MKNPWYFKNKQGKIKAQALEAVDDIKDKNTGELLGKVLSIDS